MVRVNEYNTEKIVIKSGIKQGCPMSMWLYAISIEELLNRIRENDEIKGYNFKGYMLNEIKVKAYADDVDSITTDLISIEKIIQEFDEWGEISGASINKNKTKILIFNIEGSLANPEIAQNFVKEMKILGVIFDKTGISRENVHSCIEKIKTTLNIWQSHYLNLLEKITITKTFGLSLLWFIAKFINLTKENIKNINTEIYNFIWNGKRDLIRRKTLSLPLSKGGLNAIDLESKLKSITMSFFRETINKNDQIEYFYSRYWLKFYIGKENIKNFNIVPGCDKPENEAPNYYKYTIKTIKEFKEINKNDTKIIRNIKTLKTKIFYEKFVLNTYEKPRIEEKYVLDSWEICHRNLFDKTIHSELNSFNYKVLHGSLYTLDKFKNGKFKKCYFPNCSSKESVDHIFGECSFTIAVYDHYIKLKYKNNIKREQSIREELILMQGKNDKQKEMISIFKMALWALRNIYRNGQVVYELILMDLINLYSRRFALNQVVEGGGCSGPLGT